MRTAKIGPDLRLEISPRYQRKKLNFAQISTESSVLLDLFFITCSCTNLFLLQFLNHTSIHLVR